MTEELTLFDKFFAMLLLTYVLCGTLLIWSSLPKPSDEQYDSTRSCFCANTGGELITCLLFHGQCTFNGHEHVVKYQAAEKATGDKDERQ